MHDETPHDLRDLAAQLESLGEQERREAEEACRRVARHTTHLLHADNRAGLSPGGAGVSSGVGISPARETLRRFVFWLGTPALAAAAVLLLVLVLSPNATTTLEHTGAEVLAASIERDIDTWLELEAMWVDDSFESALAALSIDAAGLASQSVGSADSPADSSETYPELEGDLFEGDL